MKNNVVRAAASGRMGPAEVSNPIDMTATIYVDGAQLLSAALLSANKLFHENFSFKAIGQLDYP